MRHTHRHQMLLMAVMVMLSYSRVVAKSCFGFVSVRGRKVSCPQGQYCKNFKVIGAKGTCEDCPSGYYCPGGTTYCTRRGCTNPATKESCPSSTCSNPGAYKSESCFVCCPAGEQYSLTSGKCELCPHGKYNNDASGATECKDCASGTYAVNSGAKGCLKCPDGLISGTGASACGCDAGYGMDKQVGGCSKCASGTYSVDGATTCTLCPAGKYSTIVGATICTNCAAGKANSQQGAETENSCLPCPKTQTSQPGSAYCSECGKGRYGAIVQAAVVCYDCPAGRWSSIDGLTTIRQCIDCQKGRYGVDAGGTTLAGACILCGRGRYADTTGTTLDCTPCGYGTYGVKRGQTQSSDCIPCEAGKYNEKPGLHKTVGAKESPCTLCPVGRYSTNDTAGTESKCLECELGSYNSEIGSVTCQKCSPGRYRNTGVAQAGNRLTPNIPHMCAPCPAGQYAPQYGTVTCTLCPLGKYSKNTGSSECKDCSEGKTTLVEGGASCDVDSPTSSPSAPPTSPPTAPKTTVTVAEQHTRLNMSDLQSGAGLHLTGESHFTQVGYYPAERYYLTISLYDTGFGPPSSGQYATFYINGEPLVVPGSGQAGQAGAGAGGDGGESDNAAGAEGKRGEDIKEANAGAQDGQVGTSTTVLRCAPVQSSNRGEACTRRDFVVCNGGYNIDITKYVRIANGGSFDIKVLTKGVLTSFCPYVSKQDSRVESSSDVYVKYTVTTFTQPTPYPTSMPSPAPTEWSGIINNNNGLQLGMDRVDVWTLVQISFAIATVMAALGVGLAALRKKDPRVQQLALPVSAVRSGMLGGEIVTLVFLILTLFQFDHSGGGLVITIFRFLQMSVGCYFLLGVYGNEDTKERIGLSVLLEKDHMVTESKVYTLVSILMILDSSYVVFLPWKSSEFAEMSKGYPNMLVFSITAGSVILQSVVSICAQAPFLAAASFDPSRDILSVFNIIILSCKLLVFGSELVMKRALLLEKTTAADEDFGAHEKNSGTEKAKDDESGSDGGDGEVTWTENPLRVSGSTAPNDALTDSDRATLLQKVSAAESAAAQAQNDVFQLRQWVKATLANGQPPKPKPTLAPAPPPSPPATSNDKEGNSAGADFHL